jgi:molecular chaperone DnaK (HSP70)
MSLRDSNLRTRSVPRPPGGSQDEFIVAIDFGTTYTGVAFAYGLTKDAAGDTGLDPEQLRDKITVLKSWPGVVGSYNDKVPTILAYNPDGQVVAWGGRVTSSHVIAISHFKLGLQDGVMQHYAFRVMPEAERQALERVLATNPWAHPSLPYKQPHDYVEDFLKEIRKYLLEVALPKNYGDAFLTNLSIRYVLTVPAIWSDKAMDLTRRSAVKAGIPESRLTMITEPEAAALYCSTLCREVDLKPGDYFLVCDAGGGTVVSSHPN